MVQFGQVYLMTCRTHPAYSDAELVSCCRTGLQVPIAWVGKREPICPAEQVGSSGIKPADRPLIFLDVDVQRFLPRKHSVIALATAQLGNWINGRTTAVANLIVYCMV